MGKFIKQTLIGWAISVVGILTLNPFLIKVGFAIQLGAIAGLLAPKPKSVTLNAQQGQNLRLTIDAAAVRPVIYGTFATSGSLVYREAYGENNKFMSLIIAVAGHEIESFGKFTFGGVEVQFSGNDAIGDFAGVMQRFTHLGTDAQTVDTALDSASVKWTSAHRLRGIAYYHLKVTFDPEKFKQGFQNPVQIIEGRKIYDPRLDDTNGGSGAHRRNDPTTWEFSNNSVLCVIDYLRGVRVNNTVGLNDGKIIAGVGVSDTRVDWANVIAEANICDEVVPVKRGMFDTGFDTGFDAESTLTQIRYTCDGIIDPAQDHRTNLDQLLSSMAGNLVYQNGEWRVYAAAPRAAIESRTTDQIVGGVSYDSKASIAAKSNGVRGVFLSADEDFKPRDYAPLQPSSFLTEDGGNEAWLNLDLPFTTDAVRAQRISKIYLLRSRFEKRLDVSFMSVGLRDQAMDTLNFTYEPFNISNQKFLIQNWAIKFVKDDQGNIGFVINENLIEEDDSIYTWDDAVDEQPVFSPQESVKNEKHNDQRNLPALNVYGALVATDPISNDFLSASESGGVATINIDAHVVKVGFGDILTNSGSITGLLVDTDFFIFADDPTFEGGAVTYVATTQIIETATNSGRRYVGTIKTPDVGGVDTGGGGGGGVSGGGGGGGF